MPRPPDARRLALTVALGLLVCARGAAAAEPPAEPPPTEPASPEFPSGRVPSSGVRNELLLVPRLVLAVPRGLVRAIAWTVRGALVLNER